MDRTDRLRLVLATPLPEELCLLLEERAPGVDLVREHDLLPPMRYPGDHGGDPGFERTAEQQARFEALLDSADALYGIPDESPEALARTVRANPRLRWVQTMAAGGASQLAAAGLSEAELDRVVVTTSAGVHARTLAEFALLGLLTGAKDVPRLRAGQRDHEWLGRWAMGQLHEQTVLVVGMGSIGRRTTELLLALGATVRAANRSPVEVPGVARVHDLDDLVAAADGVDGVVVTLPGAGATTGLIDARVIASTARGVTLVNVGRGTVVDEEALVDALRQGHVGLAALDVTATEPLPADSPLWDMDRVLLSPHTAALSASEDRRIVELAASNAVAVHAGREPTNVVARRDLA